ncbi:MAG TPA: hypothetical protein VHR39_04030 [Propionibacteriaceae bacterium]|nr:hypothetical protein [Propionibacteriaceae bacterium]
MRSTTTTPCWSFPNPANGSKAWKLQGWRRQHPAHLSMHTRRITHRDDFVVGENLISYDGRPWMYSVSLLEFRGNKVAHERIYIVDGWEAADWRAPWRSNTPADPPPPPPPSR